jgi:hypothetical protein
MFYLLEMVDDDFVTYTFFGYGIWHTFGNSISANPIVEAIMNGPAAHMIMNTSLAHYIGSLV